MSAPQEHFIKIIHSCTDNERKFYKTTTHHYTDIFTDNLLAELTDEVLINNVKYKVERKKTILITSWDGMIACWQNAPTFECKENLQCGTEILNTDGNVCSLVTCKVNNRYAISSFINESGRMLSKNDWVYTAGKGIVYGNMVFPDRDTMREYLHGKTVKETMDLVPVVYYGLIPRVIMFDRISGLEISHAYIRGEFDVDSSKPIKL